jgi:phospholipid transport system substrate-binding protein
MKNKPDGRGNQEETKMMFKKRSRIFLKIIGPVLFACFIFLPLTGAAEQKGAEEVVNRMNALLLENMKSAQALGFSGRYKLLDPVLRDVFALSYMGEKCLGSYWKDLSPEQRTQYLELYADWTISSYAGNFDSYSGEIFESWEGQQIKKDMVSVVSKLVKPNAGAIEFDYTLWRFRDKWRIVDIRISGMSQLAMTRSQFVSVMKNKGFDGLLAILKEKIEDYRAGDTNG